MVGRPTSQVADMFLEISLDFFMDASSQAACFFVHIHNQQIKDVEKKNKRPEFCSDWTSYNHQGSGGGVGGNACTWA